MNQPKRKGLTTFKRGFKTWCDKKSLELRTNLGITKYDPICAFEICKHLGIPVLTPEGLTGLSTENFNQLMFDGESDWSALTIPTPTNEHAADNLIIHNPNHSDGRQQSNMMHEIAHILCGHQIPKSEFGLSGFLRHLNQTEEDEADWLGSCIMLPRVALVNALKKGLTQKEIAKQFNASEEMVRYRINITGANKNLRRPR